MTRLRGSWHRAFPALYVRNYRLYFFAYFVSTAGVWMQRLAQDWLVLEITGSGTAVGATTALQFTPILLFGLWGGHLADRFDKRRLLAVTQSTAGVLAVVLGVLVLSGAAQVWVIYLMAFLTGCVTVVDNPARQAFQAEMVGTDTVANAVSLTSAVQTGSRIVGPALAGVTIAAVGTGWAFVLNGVSYLAVLVALWRMDPARLHRPEQPEATGPGRASDGLRYAWRTPMLRTTLALLAVVATFGMNYQVTLPLLTRFTFGADAHVAGFLMSALAVGSVTGAVGSALWSRPTIRRYLLAAAAFGMLAIGVSFTPTAAFAALVLAGVGFAAVVAMTTANATLQMHATPEMRGRVMALFGIVFLGSNPIGGLLVGWVSSALGPRWVIGLGGAISLAAVAAAAIVVSRNRAAYRPAQVPDADGARRGCQENSADSAGRSWHPTRAA